MDYRNIMDDLKLALGLLETPHGINIFAKRGRYTINTHGYNIDSLTHRIEIMGNWDVYACLNPASTTTGKPRIEDITSIRFIMLDIDPVDPDGEPLYMLNLVRTWLRERLNLDLERGLSIINSGRGIQVWIPIAQTALATSLTHNTTEIIRGFVQTISKELGIRNGCRIDTTSGEPSRVARLPGTVNSKTASVARFINYSPILPDALRLEEIEHFREVPLGHTQQLGAPLIENVSAILPAMAPWSRDFYLLGTDSRIASRHSRGYAMVHDLKKLSVSRDRARQMLIAGMSKCVPQLTDLGWMERVINLIYGD